MSTTVPATSSEAPAEASKLMLRVDDSSFIVTEILRQVGRPARLMRVEAKRTWGNHYRVNLYCERATNQTVRSLSITDSYFVTMTENGLISDPPMTRKYVS